MSRVTVGIPFEYQESWVGGVYYVENLISALGLLGSREMPAIVVIGKDPQGLEYLRRETGYPHLRRVEPDRLYRAPAPRFPLPRWLRPERADTIDVLLLGSLPGFEDRGVQWVPDFQEEHYPEFFPPSEVEERHRRNAAWFSQHRHVLVSSEAVRQDLARFYGEYRNQIHVVRFASFADARLSGSDRRAVQKRYAAPQRYLICNNQMWQHKNHRTLLEAMALLRDDPDVPPLILTGKEEDYRNPAYPAAIRSLAV